MALQEQVRRLPGTPLTEVFSVEDALQIALDVGLKYRLRLFSPWLTLCAFLWQVLDGGRSCRETVMHVLADRSWQKNVTIQHKKTLDTVFASFLKIRITGGRMRFCRAQGRGAGVYAA